MKKSRIEGALTGKISILRRIASFLKNPIQSTPVHVCTRIETALDRDKDPNGRFSKKLLIRVFRRILKKKKGKLFLSRCGRFVASSKLKIDDYLETRKRGIKVL